MFIVVFCYCDGCDSSYLFLLCTPCDNQLMFNVVCYYCDGCMLWFLAPFLAGHLMRQSLNIYCCLLLFWRLYVVIPRTCSCCTHPCDHQLMFIVVCCYCDGCMLWFLAPFLAVRLMRQPVNFLYLSVVFVTDVYCVSSQLAFFVNLHRAVIGPSATLTGRWRPDIDLRRMLTGLTPFLALYPMRQSVCCYCDGCMLCFTAPSLAVYPNRQLVNFYCFLLFLWRLNVVILRTSSCCTPMRQKINFYCCLLLLWRLYVVIPRNFSCCTPLATTS